MPTTEEVRADLAGRGVDAVYLGADIRVPEQVEGLLAATLERFGRVDVLVNNAGTCVHAPALEVVPHLDDESLVERTREIIAAPPDVVVATTGIGFRGWIEAADAVGLAEDLLDVFAAYYSPVCIYFASGKENNLTVFCGKILAL